MAGDESTEQRGFRQGAFAIAADVAFGISRGIQGARTSMGGEKDVQKILGDGFRTKGERPGITGGTVND